MTYTELADLFVRQQQSPETQRAYRADLARWVPGFLGPSDWPVTSEHAVRFREMLESTLSVASAARVFNTVRTFHKLAVAEGVIERNPFEFVKPVKRVKGGTPKSPSDVEVEALLDAAANNPRRSAVIHLLLNGLRAGEVATLTYEDMRSDPSYGFYLKVLGKGRKERLVPMLPEAAAAVLRLFNTGTPDQKTSRFLVSDVDGSPLSVRQVEQDVYKAAEYAGLQGMHPHALRHHYATRLIRAGASVLHVQKLLGHARADTTQVYVTLDLSDLVAASKLDPRYQSTGTELRLQAVG